LVTQFHSSFNWVFPVVDPLPPTQQSDVEMQAIPKELALSIKEIISLYKNHNQKK
jgi:hypothetical protein